MWNLKTLLLSIILVLITCSSYGQNAAAAKALKELVIKHRNMHSVLVKCKLNISLEQSGAAAQGKDVESDFLHIRGGDGYIKVGGYTFYIKGDTISAIHESNKEEYFVLKDSVNIHNSMLYECFQLFERIPFPHLAFFWAEMSDMSEFYMEIYPDTWDLLPASLEDRIVKGERLRTLTLKEPNATMQINYNPETFEIRTITHTITGGSLVASGAKRINKYEYEYEIAGKDDEPAKVEFDFSDRQRVDILLSLVKEEPVINNPEMQDEFAPEPKGSLIGKEAPAFLLQTTDGELVDLNKLRGNVVVIDFWAVWCPPCRAALPELHKVAKWAEKEELPVKVFAINTFESGDTLKDKLTTVLDFWNKSGHTLPVLMDEINKAAEAYGVNGIPATFVIGPDGFVYGEHSGFGPDYADQLKKEILKALEM